MKKFEVSVVMSYWQHIDVDAENEDEAKEKALDRWDESTPMYQGEGEALECEEITEGESK